MWPYGILTYAASGLSPGVNFSWNFNRADGPTIQGGFLLQGPYNTVLCIRMWHFITSDVMNMALQIHAY